MAAIQEALEGARNRAFTPTLYAEYLGASLPLADATVKLEVRLYGGQVGTALLTWEGEPTEDRATGRTAIDPEDGAIKPVRELVIEPVFALEDMAALPGLNQPEAGEPQVFEYEVILIYADEQRDSLWIGPFIVYPGVVA